MGVTRASAALLAGVPTALATLRIPAFAGMTRVEIEEIGAAIIR